jgi:arylsulfatase A-like enzyme
MCWLAIAVTIAAKMHHAYGGGLVTSLGGLRLIGWDIVVFALFGATASALGIRWPRWAPRLVWPVFVAATSLALLNAFFLMETGEQGSWYDLQDAVARRKELKMVLEDISSPELLWRSAGGLSAYFIVVVSARGLSLGRWPMDPIERSELRLRAWAGVAGLGFVLAMIAQPQTVQQDGLRKNVVTLVVKTAWRGYLPGSFSEWPKRDLVEPAEIERFASLPARANVLFVILESTRFDHTELAGQESPAKTPQLAALGKAGAVASQMRSVLPHTTKSMFSMLCGRYPTMQKSRVEPSSRGDVQCLPDVLTAAGYSTLFAQSAFGTFESRPYLVRNFGYEEFAGYEDIRGEKLSYLSSDDGSLARYFDTWLKERERRGDERPFFATFLTSATHHSYRLAKREKSRARREGLPQKRPIDRYARLVEAEDSMLAQMRLHLERRGLWENTIVVVVGDHGEGFGDHGVKQHDNNYFEEGLRVPFVLHGPGIEAKRVDHNASLIDFLPTLAASLGLKLQADAALPGHDVFAEDYPADEPKFFGCYKPHRCSGFVQGPLKYVEVSRDDESFVFDLEKDPDERFPTLATESFAGPAKRLRELMVAHRYRSLKHHYEAGMLFGDWKCSAKGVCKHPRAWKKKYRYKSEVPEPDDGLPKIKRAIPVRPRPAPRPEGPNAVEESG